MQVITYGAEDLSLTGNPQITFFSIIYRRYTNFGKKFIQLSFDNSPDFNSTSYINIPKNNGDLLSKSILKIKLPKIDFTYLNQLLRSISLVTYDNDTNSNTNKIYSIVNDNVTYYNYFLNFYNTLKNIIRLFFNNYDFKQNNLSYISELKKQILKYINVDQYNQFFSTINFFFNNNGISKNTSNYNIQLYTNASLFKIKNNELVYIYDKYTHEYLSYEGFKFTINKNLEILEELNIKLYSILKSNLIVNNNLKVCWVNKIAIYLFNSIDFYVGSNKIYSLSDTYINNYSELYYKNKKLYNNLTGNDIEINEFSEIIDEFTLYLPIPFWNLSNYGLAFPLISLQYNSLQIKINTKKLFDCIRIDNRLNQNIKFNNDIINLFSENLDKIIKSSLEITLLLEYIYLDSIERNKFARSAHEYLIEQVQEIELNKISSNNNTIQLDIFHCCKDMFWFVQKVFTSKDIFSLNRNVFNYIYPRNTPNFNSNDIDILGYASILYVPEILFNPFVFYQGIFVIDNNLKYSEQFNTIFNYLSNKFIFPSAFTNLNKIISESYFYLNGTQLFGETSNYFNYAQSYAYYNSTPQLGLNVYSFCLSPTEFQPTGSCNMSRISFIGLKLKINNRLEDSFINEFVLNKEITETYDEYKLIFQTRNFNVLRIIGGIGATAYTYN